MANRYEPIKVTGRLVKEAIAENEKRGKPHTITEMKSLLNPDYISFYFELIRKLATLTKLMTTMKSRTLQVTSGR